MTAPKRMDIWFEFSSSYSYLAVMRAEAAASKAGVTLRWRPFLLGPVFLSLGWNDSPFNIYPPKGRYMWRDMARLAEKYDIPFKMPSQFPRNGLLACRVAHLGQDEDWAGRFSRAAMAREFCRRPRHRRARGDCRHPQRSRFARRKLTGARRVAREQGSLRAQVEEAGELGLFGAPNFIVDGELFWGNDRLEDALAWAQRHAA